MKNHMRTAELENRQYGDFDMADMCREAAEAEEKGCRLGQRMALRRIVRYLEKHSDSNRLGTWVHIAVDRELSLPYVKFEPMN